MKPMRSNKVHSLIACLIACFILGVGYLTPVQAVTDAELEALEKQIEQLETEEKKQAEAARKTKVEAEAKRKAEQKRKAEAEAEKKRHAKFEQKKKEEELKQFEAKLCLPRNLAPNPSAFPEISQVIYNNPAFQNAPVPKVKWAKHITKFVSDGDGYSSRSTAETKYNYLANDGVVQKTSYQYKGEFKYVYHSDSSYNSNTQSSSTHNNQSILLGFIAIKSDGESTDSEGVKNVTSWNATIINVDGKLFPLKQGNKLNVEYNADSGTYKYQYKTEYHVANVINGESLNMGLTCKVFVILAQTETYTIEVGGDFENTSTSTYKYYFSEQLGIVVKSGPEDVDYTSETVLVDYELLPEFDVKQVTTDKEEKVGSSVSGTSGHKQKQSGDSEKRKAEVALRLKAKDPEGEWSLDSKTGCAVWNNNPQPNETFTWSGECFDGMLSDEGIIQWFKNGNKTARIEGEYLEGTLNGYGTKSWANGDSYEGEFLDGYRTGHGVYKWASGDRYEGEWKDNIRHGYGIQFWISLNQQYEGLWKDDKPVKDQ